MDFIITSPDDWPEKWRDLREIDTLLRCSICCEFMDTAVMLSKCSHSYCSLCIRRSICYKTQCPTCFVSAIESDLVSNRSLNDVIQKFTFMRKRLLDLIFADGTNACSVENETAAENKLTSSSNSHIQDTGIKSLLYRQGVKELAKNREALKQSKVPDKSMKRDKAVKKSSLRKHKAKSYAESEESDVHSNEGSDSDADLCDLTQDDDTSDEDFKPQAFTPKSVHKKTRKSASSKVSPKDIRKSKEDSTEAPTQNSKDNVSVEAAAKCEGNVDDLTLPGLNMDSCSTPKPGKFSRDESRLKIPSPPMMPSTSTGLRSPSTSYLPLKLPAQNASSPNGNHTTITRVPCPVCGVDVPQKHINLHLDRCLSNKGTREAKPPPPKRKPMPKLVYNLLKDKDLKKKCAEVGLNTDGDRKALVKRHHDFTLLYNAQCDSDNPKLASDIVRSVHKTEQAKSKGTLLTKNSSLQKLVIQKNASSDQVENAQKGYVKEHKSQFDQLIEDARRRRLAKKQSAEAAATASDQEQVGEINKDPETDPSSPSTTLNQGTDCDTEQHQESDHMNQNSAPNIGNIDTPLRGQPIATSLPPLPLVGEIPSSPAPGPALPRLDFNSNFKSDDDLSSNESIPVSHSKIEIINADTSDDEQSNSQMSFTDKVTHDEPMEEETQDPGGPHQAMDSGVNNVETDNSHNNTVVGDTDDTEPLTESQLMGSESDLFSSPESPSLLAGTYMEDVGPGPTEGTNVDVEDRFESNIEDKSVLNEPEDGPELSTTNIHSTSSQDVLGSNIDHVPKARTKTGVNTDDVGVEREKPKRTKAKKSLVSVEGEEESSGVSDVKETKMKNKKGKAKKTKTKLETGSEQMAGDSDGEVQSGGVSDVKEAKGKKKGKTKKTKIESASEQTLGDSEEVPIEVSGLSGSNKEVHSGQSSQVETGSTCTPVSHTSQSQPGSSIPNPTCEESDVDGRRRSNRRKRPRVPDEDPPPRTSKRSKKQTSKNKEQSLTDGNVLDIDQAESSPCPENLPQVGTKSRNKKKMPSTRM